MMYQADYLFCVRHLLCESPKDFVQKTQNKLGLGICNNLH